ncbi:MAG: formamidopyrimidine-DNA glycosylase [Alphaproteobacteria bacterium]|nr:formamidopyrimidine-DNA glycosylase [Alphaproteobacteria bacterium]
MPELPDITVYVEALERRLKGQVIEEVRLASPFLLRTVEPSLDEAIGKKVVDIRRLGKRVVLGLDDDLWLVFHLMIAGRFHWKKRGAKLAGRHALAAFDFANGSLTLTEFGPKKRASLHVVRGEDGLAEHDPGGIEVLDADLDSFKEALTRENHTLKRTLTDPHLFSGIGNAYSDEILHRARLSPKAMGVKLDADEIRRLYESTRSTLTDWLERLRAEAGEDFPETVKAARAGMAVHGRFNEPCPDCGTPVQRLRRQDSESNYCPRCQTNGEILADRSTAQLFKGSRPRTIEDLAS